MVETLTAAVQRDGTLYVAQCLEVDIASQGETFEEAVSNLKEALELYFEDHELPRLLRPIIAPVSISIAA